MWKDVGGAGDEKFEKWIVWSGDDDDDEMMMTT